MAVTRKVKMNKHNLLEPIKYPTTQLNNHYLTLFRTSHSPILGSTVILSYLSCKRGKWKINYDSLWLIAQIVKNKHGAQDYSWRWQNSSINQCKLIKELLVYSWVFFQIFLQHLIQNRTIRHQITKRSKSPFNFFYRIHRVKFTDSCKRD